MLRCEKSASEDWEQFGRHVSPRQQCLGRSCQMLPRCCATSLREVTFRVASGVRAKTVNNVDEMLRYDSKDRSVVLLSSCAHGESVLCEVSSVLVQCAK